MPNYWLDVFTVETWGEAKAVGFTVSGFSKTRYRSVEQLQPGDILICYLKGLKVLIGALRIDGPAYLTEEPRIWKSQPFPARVPVKPAVILDQERAVDFVELLPQMSFFKPDSPRSTWAVLQGSPTRLSQRDGEVLWSALTAAQSSAEGVKIAATVPSTRLIPPTQTVPSIQTSPKLKAINALDSLITEIEQAQRDASNTNPV